MPVTAPPDYEIVTAAASSDYFVTKGTLPLSAASYVVRKADEDLYRAIEDGQYAYVLNTRQMGKSSLVIRTVARLRQNGYHVALLDLTSIGLSVTVEQWYGGLLQFLGEQLGYEDELDDFWDDNLHLGPMQRFFGAINNVLLKNLSRPVVIFIDEIDAVRSLPFSSDEFFTGIRASHNASSKESRLVFSLIGSATPSELVVAPELSPFNIGQRIEITDFTLTEALPLARALGSNGTQLLQRVLHWTGGHPYLTQRLCQDLVATAAKSVRDVDVRCNALFLHPSACDRDDNLAFVRNRLLKERQHSVEHLLHTYGLLLQKRPVRDDERSPLCAILKLSGIAKTAPSGGFLVVRNRIYERVFNLSWVEENTNSDEIQRQRVAAQKARNQTLLLTGAIIVILLLLLSGILYFLQQARQERDRARAVAYAANINLAHAEQRQANHARVRELLDDTPATLRGMEWRYLDNACPLATTPLTGHSSDVLAVDFSPGGTGLVSGSEDGSVRLWNIADRSYVTITRGDSPITAVAFAPNQELIATGGEDHTVRIFQVNNQNLVLEKKLPDIVRCLFVTPQNDAVLIGLDDGRLFRLDLMSQSTMELKARHQAGVTALALSPSGTRFASVSRDGKVLLWDLAKLAPDLPPIQSSERISCSLAFSPNGKRLAVAGWSGSLTEWDAQTGAKLGNSLDLPPSLRQVSRETDREGRLRFSSVAYSDDSAYLFAGCNDGNIRLWKTLNQQYTTTFVGHRGFITALCASRRTNRIASASADRTVVIWQPFKQERNRTVPPPEGHSDTVSAIVTDPGGKSFLTSGWDGQMLRWNVDGLTRQRRELQTGRGIVTTALLTDSRLATIEGGGTLRLWQTASGKEIPLFEGRDKVNETASSLAFSAKFRQLFAVTNTNQLMSVTLDTPEAAPKKVTIEGLNCVAVTPDGALLITGCNNREDRLMLWRIGDSLREVDRYSLQSGGVTTIACAVDGNLFVTGHQDGSALIWSARQHGPNRQLAKLSGHPTAVVVVAVSAKGDRVATGGYDGNIRLWDTVSKRQLLSLSAQEIGGTVSSMAFLPDDSALIVGCTNGSLHVLSGKSATTAQK